MTAAGNLSLEEAVAAATAGYELKPAEGDRYVHDHVQHWRGWRVTFVDRRGRPRIRELTIYHRTITPESVEAAISSWFHQRGR